MRVNIARLFTLTLIQALVIAIMRSLALGQPAPTAPKPTYTPVQIQPAACDQLPVGTLPQSKRLRANELNARLKALSADQSWSAIQKDLGANGFTPATDPGSLWAEKTAFEGENGQKWVVEVFLQENAKKGSKDTATAGRISADIGGKSKNYTFWAFNPGSKFSEDSGSYEMFVKPDLSLAKANSWKSCMKRKVRKAVASCAAPCVAAALTCTGTFAAYLACVGAACGTCLAINIGVASAACAIDSWW